ncbi:hypothetical protein AB0H34_37805 [Saccharopolyspora shandongensis]
MSVFAAVRLLVEWLLDGAGDDPRLRESAFDRGCRCPDVFAGIGPL